MGQNFCFHKTPTGTSINIGYSSAGNHDLVLIRVPPICRRAISPALFRPDPSPHCGIGFKIFHRVVQVTRVGQFFFNNLL